jgi:hypothetical protein
MGKISLRVHQGEISSKRTSTVVKYGLRTNAEDAAFANAVFGHGFEMDDSVLRLTSHPVGSAARLMMERGFHISYHWCHRPVRFRCSSL